MTTIRIERVDLIRLAMRLREPFETSFGPQQERHIVLVRALAEGVEGWGELVAASTPVYSEETVDTAVLIIRAHLLPLILGRRLSDPREVSRRWAGFRGNPMAKAAVEMACWDAWARAAGRSLSQVLGGTRAEVATGVSVGLQQDLPALLDRVGGFADQGYARIKLKIMPGRDLALVAAVRERFGDLALMVDANAAYTLEDADHLSGLDDFGLMMIEQPLAYDDIVDHATLAAKLVTPICLDESIRSATGARQALQLGACRIVNLKLGRVGGYAEALALHDLCHAGGVPLWCGGMLESGVGRLHNIALASLPGFTLPGDTSASDRYWAADIIDPPVTLSERGTVRVPTAPGLGHELDTERLDFHTVHEESIRP